MVPAKQCKFIHDKFEEVRQINNVAVLLLKMHSDYPEVKLCCCCVGLLWPFNSFHVFLGVVS